MTRTSVIALAAACLCMSATANANQATPLHLSGTLRSTTSPSAECRGLHNSDSGYLAGTPLARAKFDNSECLDLVESPGSMYVRNVVFTLTTTAGTLSGTYTARGGLPDSSLHVYVWGPFKITRGTGKYKRATGSGLIAADADILSSTVYVELSGSLRT